MEARSMAELDAVHHRAFRKHLRSHILLVLGLILVSLAIGMIGFQLVQTNSWTDAYLNAAMLLGGMGPVKPEDLSHAGKLFAATYALYCGLVFVAVIGIILNPFVTRVIRRLDAMHPSR